MKKKLSLYAVTILLTTLLLAIPTHPAYSALPSPPWFEKPSFPDYARSGMPDFDQRQGGTYLWQQYGMWSHCGPVAVANSLWWLDSEFENSTTAPPTMVDTYHLVTAYGAWDDHDPQNVAPLVEHLAYLMDCDGRRTGIAKLGTNVFDMQAGITHYLSWTGVNPLGDVDGNGIVDANDQVIVAAAMGKSPGMPGWDIRADIFPASISYPPFADNIIDPQDMNLVIMNMGQRGQFYEHTILAPLWEMITTEVLQCQDVVLLVVPWIFDPPSQTWYRYAEGAHFVTVAGVDVQGMQISLSDPINDNAEAGFQGDVPVPHPPSPPYTIHNNATLVSHDVYKVIMAPCPGGPLTLIPFPGSIVNPPGAAWQIEAAVITSPLLEQGGRDIAVTGLTVCFGQTNLSKDRNHRLNVTVTNQGSITDVFTLTCYWDGTHVLGTTRMSLLVGQTKIVSFLWYANQPRYIVYTPTAVVTPVCGETDTADNTFIGPAVKIVWPGDVNGDHAVSILDVTMITGCYAMSYPSPAYRPNADIDDTGKVDILDVVLCTGQYAVVIPP